MTLKTRNLQMRRHASAVLGIVIALSGSVLNSAAPQAPSDQNVSQEVTDLEVYLVTIGPGELLWERFGHNAIWIRDRDTGIERAYNYGLFSFEQEDFLKRFLQGRMEYWMRGFDAGPHLQEYMAANRTVVVQELNLSRNQKIELRDFLVWNKQPENRFYRYHYYWDNCSTRIRDAIDRVTNGAIRDQMEHVYPGHTLRYHSLRLVANDLWTSVGLLLGLGQPVDEPLSAWEEMFLPMKLRDHLRNVFVPGEDGDVQSLVASERTLHESTEFFERAAPPRWTPWFLVAGLLLGLATLLLARKAKESRTARAAFAALTTLWYAFIGIVGLGLAGLWLLTDHDTSYRNENLFWFDPVAILLVVLAPLLIYRVQWTDRIARLIAVFVAGVAILGLVLKIVPGMDQMNAPLIAFALPSHIAFVAGLLWVSSIEGGRQ